MPLLVAVALFTYLTGVGAAHEYFERHENNDLNSNSVLCAMVWPLYLCWRAVAGVVMTPVNVGRRLTGAVMDRRRLPTEIVVEDPLEEQFKQLEEKDGE